MWSGDRQLVPVGRAWVAWRFFRLTRDEMQYLRDNFGAAVTIRTLDKGANAFANFNATLVLPDPARAWEADGWQRRAGGVPGFGGDLEEVLSAEYRVLRKRFNAKAQRKTERRKGNMAVYPQNPCYDGCGCGEMKARTECKLKLMTNSRCSRIDLDDLNSRADRFSCCNIINP